MSGDFIRNNKKVFGLYKKRPLIDVSGLLR